MKGRETSIEHIPASLTKWNTKKKANFVFVKFAPITPSLAAFHNVCDAMSTCRFHRRTNSSFRDMPRGVRSFGTTAAVVGLLLVSRFIPFRDIPDCSGTFRNKVAYCSGSRKLSRRTRKGGRRG